MRYNEKITRLKRWSSGVMRGEASKTANTTDRSFEAEAPELGPAAKSLRQRAARGVHRQGCAELGAR